MLNLDGLPRHLVAVIKDIGGWSYLVSGFRCAVRQCAGWRHTLGLPLRTCMPLADGIFDIQDSCRHEILMKGEKANLILATTTGMIGDLRPLEHLGRCS